MNPHAQNDYELRMNIKSLNAGLTKFYGGKENAYLAQLILCLFSKGKENSEVSYY